MAAMSSSTQQLQHHRPRLMRAPHTSPPLPATTTTASLLVSHRSPAAAAAAACWENSISNDDLRLNHDDDRDDLQAQHVQDHLLIDTLAAASASASASASAAQQMKPKRRNHIARLPQELLLHILTFVHSSLVYPPNPCDNAYFLPLEQRRQTASLAFLRLAAVSPQFAAAILSPQASSLWKHIDGSATFPIPPAKIETGLHEQEQKAQQALLFRPRHLAPALVVALARTAGPAVTSLNLRGVQFTSAVEPHGGISSLFSAAQLFEHILEAQGVPSSRDAQPPNFAYAQDKHAGAYTPKHDSDDDEEPLPAMSPLSHFSVLGPPPPQSSVPAPPLLPRTTQLTHIDLRSLRIDPVQLASARRALSALLAASPSLVSLRLANASPRLVDDALLDSSLTHPHRLRELDVSRCAGVSAEGVVRLLRRVAEYQSDQVQKGDEDTARDAGLAVLRIVGLRTKPPAPISGSGPEPREEISTRRRRRTPVQLDDDGDDDNADDSDEDGQAAEDGGHRGSDESSASSPAAAVPTNPLEDLMALLGRTSAHTLEVLDASYVLDLTDAHVFALAHTNPQAVPQRGATAASASASTSASSHSGPPKQMTLRHAQTKLSRALASAAHFPTHRSALARALDESSSLTNTVERTLFPRLRSLALSSNPRLTAASCGFLVGALPRCETLELGGWAPRAFLDFERDADGRRVQRRQRRGRRAGEQELPGDGPLVDLLESMPNIRRVDLEGASEITDAVLRVLTPAPTIRPTPSPSTAPTVAGAAMLSSEAHAEDGVAPQAQPQPGQYLTHLILSHAYRLSARATLDLMRGATQLVHLELDDTRAGCDLVAKEWAALTKARKSGLRAAAVALALLPPSQQQQKEGRQQKEEAPTPYLSLVDCRGFSKEEYERLSRRGYIRAREAIGVRPRLSHVPSELEQKAAEDGVAASDVGQQSEGGAAKEVVEEAEVFEWGREWFGYEGRAEVVPVRDAPAANSASAGAGAGIVSPDTNATTPSPPGQPASTPSVATASPPSRASRLTLSLPLGLGIAALARRASGHLTTPESEDEEEAGGGQGDAGNAHQLSIPGLPFRIRVQRGGGGQNAGGGGGASSNTGGGGLLMSGGGGADKHGFEGDETNPALGVLKSFWGWQTVDARTKARKKRLAKEEKARKAAAAAAAAAASAASRNRGMSMRPNGPNSRSLSFGGLDAALRGNGNESPQGGGSGGASTGLRNSTAAALALLLRRTGASSAGAAMSAAFGPMSMASPPLSRSPSPPTSPAVVGGGIPIPGASQQGGGGGGGRARAAAGGSPGRLGQGLARRSDSGFSGFLLQASPSTPGAQSTMSAFSLMALAGQRGGAIPPASSSSAYAYAFSSSPSTSPSLERHMHLHYGGGGGEGRNHQLSTRQLLAFAEAAAAAGLSATEAEMLAIAATSTTATARARTRSLTATTTESGFGRLPRGQSGPLSAVAAGKRPQIHSRLNSGASASSAAGSSGGGSQNYQPLLFSPLHPQGRAQQQQRGEDLALVRTQSSGGLSSLREKMRERGGRAKGKIRRLLQSASGVGSASAGASPSGSRSGSVLNFGATIHQIGSPSSSSSRPGSGLSTPRRRMTAPATPTFGMGGRGSGAGAGASGSSAPLPPPSLPLPASSPSSIRTSVPTPTPAAAPTMPVPQHYAPPAAAGGGALGMQGLGWDEDEDEDEEDQEGDGQGCVVM